MDTALLSLAPAPPLPRGTAAPDAEGDAAAFAAALSGQAASAQGEEAVAEARAKSSVEPEAEGEEAPEASAPPAPDAALLAALFVAAPATRITDLTPTALTVAAVDGIGEAAEPLFAPPTTLPDATVQPEAGNLALGTPELGATPLGPVSGSAPLEKAADGIAPLTTQPAGAALTPALEDGAIPAAEAADDEGAPLGPVQAPAESSAPASGATPLASLASPPPGSALVRPIAKAEPGGVKGAAAKSETPDAAKLAASIAEPQDAAAAATAGDGVERPSPPSDTTGPAHASAAASAAAEPQSLTVELGALSTLDQPRQDSRLEARRDGGEQPAQETRAASAGRGETPPAPNAGGSPSPVAAATTGPAATPIAASAVAVEGAGIASADAAGASAAPVRLPEPPQAARPAAHAQVGQQIVRRFEGGGVSFAMRLDPPELGQVTVQLEVSGDGGVRAHVGAETPAALADLMRNARELERALTGSGLRLEGQGLTFDLNERSDGRSSPEQERRGRSPQTMEAEPAASAPVRMRSLSAMRIDVLA